tara:strand:- start:565 stop:774 length:210 start_codon:yes stop_codon:yes gene_type:complete
MIVSEWISVDDDKKPKIGEVILCYGFSGENEESLQDKDYDMGEMTSNGFHFFALCNGTVTHWHQLEPPK